MKNILLLLFLSQQVHGQSVKTGKWSDPATWKNRQIPKGDVVINSKHTVMLDTSVTIGKLTISATASLIFKRTKSLTLQLRGNLVNKGRLIANIPAAYFDTIRFIEVDESQFIGGGMDIMDTDKGLWDREAGTLELSGAAKTSWTRLLSAAKKGDTIINVELATAWKVNDELSIVPTLPNSDPNFYKAFDEVKIKKISGTTVTISALKYDHPAVYNSFNKVFYRAEVLNLTRNIVIEGTERGRAHINIGMVSQKVNISNIQIRYMGPRNDGEKILGRYPLHFHMNGDASRGSIIDGVVVRDCGSHAFVPHASNGITFKNCIAYNTYENQYWWDFPPDNGKDSVNNSHDIIYDNCIGAKLIAEPSYSDYRLTNFIAGSGRGNIMRNCVAIGNYGAAGAAGFGWPESSNFTDNLWTFANNISHNNRTDGIFVWQNDSHSHTIKNFAAYNNGQNGIEQGAYVNAYKYTDVFLINNKYGLYLHSLPIKTGTPGTGGSIVEFTRLKSTDPLYIAPHTIPGSGSTLFKDCIFPKVIVSELPRRTMPAPGLFDFINCNLKYEQFEIIGQEEGGSISVQDSSRSFEIRK